MVLEKVAPRSARSSLPSDRAGQDEFGVSGIRGRAQGNHFAVCGEEEEMKLSALLHRLAHYPTDAEVVFATTDYCPEGYPEWQDARVKQVEGVLRIEMDRLTDELLEMQQGDS